MIITERLILRPWHEEDVEAFVAMNGDLRVMEYFLDVRSRQQSLVEYKKFVDHISKYGWGLWAAALKEDDRFIGFIGLNTVPFEAPFTPAVEIGWRLAHEFWGKGYATEGARAALKYGFETVKLDEIVSFTSMQNSRSRGVMEKIGLRRDPADDFDHPGVPQGHHLRQHVLYRLKARDYANF